MRTKSGPRSGRGGRSVAKQTGVKASSQGSSSELDNDYHNDVSQQQVPIPTSVRSMRDLCRLMETATEEVREYLTDEFSIMYECKTCYSIFRSLANLISHKRFYCTTRYINRSRPAGRDYVLDQLTQLVIPTEPEVGPEERWNLGDDGLSPTRGQPWPYSIKTSIPPIGQGGTGIKTRDSADGGSVAPLQSKNKPNSEFSVHLEHLTKNAVYQTVSYEGSIGDLMSDQVAEVHNLNVDSQVTLGPDGKILSEQPHERSEDVKENSNTATNGNMVKSPLKNAIKNDLQTTGSQYYVCGTCNSTCSTRKTLAYHMQYMHSKFRMCYPCLYCKSTFSKIWNVSRHLCKVHHKTTHQVNKLRDVIQKKAFKKPVKECRKIQEVKIKPEATVCSDPGNKLSRQQQLIQENQIFMENVDGISKTQVCVACGTKFERQAALYSHLQRCPKQLRKLKLQQTSAAGDMDANVRPTTEAETSKNPARVTTFTATAETDSDYDENAQRVPVILSDVPPVSSHISFSAKGVDSACIDAEETSQQGMTDRGRSEKMQIVNPYRCGSERESSTEKKIKIEVRKDYMKSVGASTKNSISSAVTDDLSDSDDGGKVSVGAPEAQSNQMESLDVDVGSGDKERTLYSCTDGQEPEEVQKKVLPSNSEVALGSPKMISVLKKSHELNSDICSGVSNRNTLLQKNTLDIKSNVNLSCFSPQKKTAFSPHMEKKMESLINAVKLQCLTCRKKFKKMTNLRRHVALHIDWYRYRCTVCFFRCFAKYDCVAHVIKVHLKDADRARASSMVELLQNQEPDAKVENGSQSLMDISKNNRSVNTVNNTLDVEVLNISDCQRKHLEQQVNSENLPKESGIEALGTSFLSICQGEVIPNTVDLPDLNACGRVIEPIEKTDLPEELNVKCDRVLETIENANILDELDLKCNEESQMSSSDEKFFSEEHDKLTNPLLSENDFDIMFGKYLSDKNCFTYTDNICSNPVDGNLCKSSTCLADNFQVDDIMSKDITSTEITLEKDECEVETIVDCNDTDRHSDKSVETVATPEPEIEKEANNVVNGSVEKVALPSQNIPEKFSLLAKSSAEKVVFPTECEISSGSTEKVLVDKQTNVQQTNPPFRITYDRQAYLKKVIDEMFSRKKDLSLKDVGSDINLQDSRESCTGSVSVDSGKCDVGSDINLQDSRESCTGSVSVDSGKCDVGGSLVICQSQSDSTVPMMAYEENIFSAEVSVKTEIDPDIMIEYEGKRVTAINREGRFMRRRRRERIGSDSNMLHETEEQSCSLSESHFYPKRKRSHSESRNSVRQCVNVSFSDDQNVDADNTQSEIDVAKSSRCRVEGTPCKDSAVQQMVMQVIFGGENGQESSENFTLNGDVFVPKGGDYCPSAAESTSTASSSPNWMLEEPSLNYGSIASPESDVAMPFSTVISQQQGKSYGSGSARKRLRPVRNRVKVEREDFIYDYGLSDICMVPKDKVSEDVKKLVKRKEQVERCGKESPSKANARYSVNPNLLSQDVKLVLPKLTLVRTDDTAMRSEYSVKVTEDIKTCSSSSSSSSGSNPGKSGVTNRKKMSAVS